MTNEWDDLQFIDGDDEEQGKVQIRSTPRMVTEGRTEKLVMLPDKQGMSFEEPQRGAHQNTPWELRDTHYHVVGMSGQVHVIVMWTRKVRR